MYIFEARELVFDQLLCFCPLALKGLPRGRLLCVVVPDGAGPLEVLAVQVPQDAPPQGGKRCYARAGHRGWGDARPLVGQVRLRYMLDVLVRKGQVARAKWVPCWVQV